MVKVVKLQPGDAPDEGQADQAESIDFTDLVSQAASIDNGGPAGPSSTSVVNVTDPAAAMTTEFFALLKMPRSLLASRFAWWPEFGTVWSDDQLRTIAGSLAALCIDQGWSIDELMGKYGPWIAVAVMAGMPAFVTWSAIQDRRAELVRQAALELQQATSAQHRGDAQ